MAASLPPEMRSAIISPGTPLTAIITPTPLPKDVPPDHILIKVHAAASNPKDYLHLTGPANSGDDLAGTVVARGSRVSRFRPGERVAAMHEMMQPFGSYAEYALAPQWTTVRIPKNMGFEEASTLPLVSLTAAMTLFRRQGFAAPWENEIKRAFNANRMLLVYGASSALGSFAIKLAKIAGVGHVIAVGGESSTYVRSLLREERDVLIDYRSASPHWKTQVRDWVEERGVKSLHALDCVSADQTWVPISQVMDDGGVLSVFNGRYKYDEPEIPSNVKVVYTFVGSGHTGVYRATSPKQPPAEEAKGDIAFAERFFGWLEGALSGGKYEGHPYEVVPGGLEGVVEGLNRLKSGAARGRKLVYRIA